jgi:hypothetical protein
VTDLLLPNSIHLLSSSAIAVSSLITISFWPGQCEFQVHELFIKDITGQSVIRYFGRSCVVVIESRIEILCEFCFYNCQSLTSVTFKSNSKLQRIEQYAFAKSGLTTIQVPASVEVLCKYCFYNCQSLTSITFESHSKLREVAADCFKWSPYLQPIEYPPSLSEQSQTIVSQTADTHSSSIADKE